MINILHAIDTGGPGGAETVFLNLVRGLDRSGFRSTVAIGSRGEWLRGELVRGGIEPLVLPTKGSFNFTYLRQLTSAVRRHRIQLIHSHLPGSNVYCGIAGLLCRVPVISTFHGFIETDRADTLFTLKLRIINHASKGGIVFVSEGLRAAFQDMVKWTPERCHTIYNGLNLAVFRPARDTGLRREFGVTDDQFLIGAVGNIRPAKGYDDFLRAARIIIDRHPFCRFVIVGEGSGALLENLLDRRSALGLEDKVHFAGFRQDIAKVINNFDLFLLTSRTEGFSLTCVEAMACGVPVVATRSGGPEEIISHEVDGLLVPVGRPEEIADGVTRLIEAPKLRDLLVQAGRVKVAGTFDLATMITGYIQLYRKTLGRASKGQP
jgi:glycosyltransferase involved in cell wall biosynthesis